MKKTLLFIFMLAITFANAQFNDDIESYSLGPLHTGHWTSWDGTTGAIDAIVSNDIAASGVQSVLIAEGQTQDCMLSFIDGSPDAGQITTGVWYFDFNMYIPSGSTGYFNMQNLMPAGTEFNFHVNFNQDSGNPGGGTIHQADGASQGSGTLLGDFVYPEDAWFHISLVYDLDNITLIYNVDGTEVYNGEYFSNGAAPAIGGIDFFSVDAANRYYIDDVRFDATAPASIEDLQSLGFTSYPNPVKDKLTLNAQENITNVSIYNIIGQEVRNININALEANIDMSDLNAGAYFVKVSIGNTVGTIKILK